VEGRTIRTCSTIGAAAAGALFLAAGCAAAPPPPVTPVTGAYLSGRLAARENRLDLAADAFRRVAESERVGELASRRRVLRQSFFYNLAAGEIDAAFADAERLVAVGDVVAARQAAANRHGGGATDAAANLGDAGPVENARQAREADADQEADGLARLALAVADFKAGAYESARAHLDFASGEPFVASVTHLLQAWSAFGAEGPAAGLRALEDAPDDIFTGFHATHVALMAEPAGAISLAQEAHRNSVVALGGPVGRAAYGAFLERHGGPDDAREYYRLIEGQPGPDRRSARAAFARIDRGRPSRAFADITPAEGAAIALYSFGGFLLEQLAEQRERAESAGFNVGEPRYNLPLSLTQLAIYLDPDLVEARRLAGAVFNLYGDEAAAIEVLRPIPPSSPHYEQARVEIAGGLSRAGRRDEAIRVLKRTVRRVDEPVEARFALGNLLSLEERYEDAIHQFSRVIDALPPDPPTDAWRYFVARGDAYLKVDDFPSAETDLKRAVEIAPDEPTTLNYLGYVWAERGVNLDEAFDLIEKALAADRTSGAITDSLGWAYYQTGDYETAVGYLEEAAALEPADPTVTEHLGDVYWRLGRPREAEYQWRRALELDPDDKQRAAIEKKIEEGLPADPPSTSEGRNAGGSPEDAR